MPIDPAQEYPLGIRPQTPLWRENFALLLPDGRILVGRNFGRNTEAAVVSAAPSCS